MWKGPFLLHQLIANSCSTKCGRGFSFFIDTTVTTGAVDA